MRKFAIVLIAIALLSVSAMAQKAEVFGGYQYFRFNPGSGFSGANFNGWDAALEGKFTKNVGIVADISGAYKSESGVSVKFHNFLFGPQVSFEAGKLKPFVRGLVGVSHASAGAFGSSGSDNAFAVSLGGGVDAMIHKNFGIRVAQFDYLMTRFGGETQNNVRYAAGVVVRF